MLLRDCGYDVYQNENPIGKVTSGAPSPSLKCNIGFASISQDTGKTVEIDIRGKLHPRENREGAFFVD